MTLSDEPVYFIDLKPGDMIITREGATWLVISSTQSQSRPSRTKIVFLIKTSWRSGLNTLFCTKDKLLTDEWSLTPGFEVMRCQMPR